MEEVPKKYQIPTDKLVSVDLDGVLCLNYLNRKLYRPNRMHEFYSLGLYSGFAKGIPVFIITARKERYRKCTMEWLADNHVLYSGLFMLQSKVEKNKENCLAHKAKFINGLGIDLYFEDSEAMIKGLRKLCPKTQIIDVT